MQPRDHPRPRGRARVDLTFEINEAPRVYVERIDISGNTRTQDRVIRREFRLAEGDAFNAAQVRRSRQRIRDLGYFRDVADRNSTPGSAPDRAMLNTTVAERPTGEVSLGGGYSTDAGFLADFGMRERNLLGTGIDARINGTLAQRRSQVDFSITDPYFLDRNLAAGVDIFYIQRNLQHDRLLPRAARTASRCAPATTSTSGCGSPGPTAWSTATSTTSPSDASRFIQRAAGHDAAVADRPDPDLRHARQPDRAAARLRRCASAPISPASAATSPMSAPALDGAYYIPLERCSATRTTCSRCPAGVGYLETLCRQAATASSTASSSAARTCAASRIAGAGPRDTRPTQRQLGGRFIWTQSTEMRFPLPLPAETRPGRPRLRRCRLAVDTPVTGPGRAWTTPSPRVGAGVGVSWRSPFGLINIDIAQAVVKKPYDQTQVFRFGFGTRF